MGPIMREFSYVFETSMRIPSENDSLVIWCDVRFLNLKCCIFSVGVRLSTLGHIDFCENQMVRQV